jgi:hypothetical protein
MTSPDVPPLTPNPEQLHPFDRAVANMQEVLNSSPRTRVLEEDMFGDTTRQITLGTRTVSEHRGEDGQDRYRAGTTGDLVWVFDPGTRTVHEGTQDPSFNLELSDTQEVGPDSYTPLTDQLPQLLAYAKANKRVGYPRSALSAAVGRLSLTRLTRRKKQ